MAKTARLEAAKSDALQWYAALFGRLESLEPTEFRLIHFQKKKKTLHLWGNLENEDDIKSLEKLNNEGYGIYAVVNGVHSSVAEKIERTKNTDKPEGTLDKDIISINAAFVEIDSEEKTPGQHLEMLMQAPLSPSLIVQSSTPNKLHGYWTIADCPVDKFRSLQIQLIAKFGGDVTCKNESRVMRVPGFWNLKANLQSKLIYYDPVVYTFIEFCEAFEFDPDYTLHLETPVTVPDGWQPKAGIEKRIFASAQKRVEKVKRENAGRHKLLVWAAFSAFENRLDRAGASRLMAQIIAVMPPRQAGPIPVSEGEAVLDWVYTRTPGKPWDYEEKEKPPDGVVSYNANVVIRESGYALEKTAANKDITYQQLSNWTFEPLLKLLYPDGSIGERGNLYINGHVTHNVDVAGKAWNSRGELLAALGQYGALLFTNSSSDVAKIRQYILLHIEQLPNVKGVNTFGLHRLENKWISVFENGNLGDGDAPQLFYAGVSVDPHSPYFALPKKGTTEEILQAKGGIIDFTKLITPAAAFAMLGYGISSAYGPRLTALTAHRLPFLYIAGEREVGKTSAAQLVLQLVTGDQKRERKASNLTVFQYDLAFSNANNLLALLDEYRPGAIDESQLRKHHDLEIKWRGTGKLDKNIAYNLNSPMMVSGEGMTEDAASLSRGVAYFLKKSESSSSDEYARISSKPLWAYAHHLHSSVLALTDEQVLERKTKAEKLAKDVLSTRTPRLQYALTYIAFGLLHLQQDVSASVFSDDAILETLRAGVSNTLEGGTETSTNLEMFLEQLGSVLASHKQPDSIVIPGKVPGDLIIRISAAVEAVKERYKANAAIGNPRMLRKFASEAPYCEEGLMHKAFNDDAVRGIKVKLAEVPERCDIEQLKWLFDKFLKS
jgi:hypothetical protein